MPAYVEINGRLEYYRPQLYPLPPSPQQLQAVADAKTKTNQDITTVRSDINGASGASADGTSLDTSLPNLMAAVENELRLNADLAPPGGETNAIENAAAAIKQRAPDAKWLGEVVDDAKDGVEQQDASQRNASEKRDAVLDAQDSLQSAMAMKVTNRTIADEKQAGVSDAQSKLDQAVKNFKNALGTELSEYEKFGTADDLKAANDAVSQLSAAHPEWDTASLDMARVIAVRHALQYQVDHINPNDPKLSPDLQAVAKNDPVTFACEQLLAPYKNDKDAFGIAEFVGSVSFDVRVSNTKKLVDQLMSAGDANGALKALSINMNAVSFSQTSPQARQELFRQAGEKYFGANSAYFNQQIGSLTTVYKLNPDDPDATQRLAYDDTVKSDAVGQWMKTLAKDAPPEVAANLLQTVEGRFNDNGHWFQNNAGQLRMGIAHGTDFYGGLSLTALAADTPSFRDTLPSTAHAQQVADWLTSNRQANAYLDTLGASGSVNGSSDWAPITNAVGDTQATSLTTALLAHRAVLPEADALQHAFDLGKQTVQTKQAAADYDAFQSNVDAGLTSIFGQMSAATFGRDAPIFDGKSHVFNAPGADTQLDNFIGASLMVQADNSGAQDSGDINTAWFTNKNSTKVIDGVRKAIREAGGADGAVTAIPIAYVDKSTGVAPTALFKVVNKQSGKITYVDDRGTQYGDIKDFRHNNALADGGTIYVPNDANGALTLNAKGVPDVAGLSAHVTTGWQRVRHGLDFVFGVATLSAGVVLMAGTGGVATPIAGGVMAAGAGWAIGESVDRLTTLSEHGRSISPFDPEARADWLTIAVSVAGEGSLAAGGVRSIAGSAEAAGGLRGMTPLIVNSNAFRVGAKGADLTAGLGGAFMTGDQALTLMKYGDKMSGEAKAEAVLLLGLGLGGAGLAVRGGGTTGTTSGGEFDPAAGARLPLESTDAPDASTPSPTRQELLDQASTAMRNFISGVGSRIGGAPDPAIDQISSDGIVLRPGNALGQLSRYAGLDDGTRAFSLDRSAEGKQGGQPPSLDFVLRLDDKTQRELPGIVDMVDDNVDLGPDETGKSATEALRRGKYQRVFTLDSLVAHADVLSDMRHALLNDYRPDAIIGLERGGAFVADTVTTGSPDLASRVVKVQKVKAGDVAAAGLSGSSDDPTAPANMIAMKQAVEDQIRAGKKRFAFTEVYFSGTAVNTIYKYVIKPLSEQYPDCQFKGFWLHEGTTEEATAALQGTDGLKEKSEVFSTPFILGEDVEDVLSYNSSHPLFIADVNNGGTLNMDVLRPNPGETTRELLIRILRESGKG